jgi:Ser/Thr protein kinase RdoA (MazF antagonist)
MSPITASSIVDHLRSRGFDALRAVEYAQGIAARNFLVACLDGSSLVVRCDVRRNVESVREDRLFGILARRSGIATPSGRWRIEQLDQVTLAIRPHMPGATLAELAPPAWPSPREIGRTLRRIHCMPPPATSRTFFYAAIWDHAHPRWQQIEAAVAHYAQRHSPAAKLVRHAWRRITAPAGHAALAALRASPVSTLHGDYTPSNLLASSRGLVVLDWEKACVGPAGSDIAQALYYLCAARPDDATSFAAAWLDGYGATANDPAQPNLVAWLHVHPSFIFLVDAANAELNRRLSADAFDPRRETYFLDVSAPRYARHLRHEAALLRALA